MFRWAKHFFFFVFFKQNPTYCQFENYAKYSPIALNLEWFVFANKQIEVCYVKQCYVGICWSCERGFIRCCLLLKATWAWWINYFKFDLPSRTRLRAWRRFHEGRSKGCREQEARDKTWLQTGLKPTSYVVKIVLIKRVSNIKFGLSKIYVLVILKLRISW